MTASEKILQKALVASNIDSRQWNSIQAGLRDRAFFSSRVAQANILDALQKRTAEYSDGHTSISEIRKRMRQDLETMHYTPEAGTEGTIKDLYSKARLDVIIKQNVATARGFIRWAEGNEPGAYAAFPAQEFKRVHPRKHGRPDWPERWAKAGGKFYGGRMIALKDDPVWTNLSIFGTPYPPFDWGSGMGVRDIDRKTAIELKLIDDAGIREKVKKLEEKRDRGETPSMNGNLQATIPDDNNEVRAMLVKDFGDLVRFENGTIQWRPEVMQEAFRSKDFKIVLGQAQRGLLEKLIAQDNMFEFASAILGERLEVTQDWRDTKRPDGTNHLSHFGPEPNKPSNIPMSEKDLEMLPSLWRNPDRVVKLTGERFQTELDAFDGSTYCLQIAIKTGDGKTLPRPKVWSFFKTMNPTSKKLGLK